MSLKTFLVSRIAEHITSEQRLKAARSKAEHARLQTTQRHRIEYFHQIDDPYSHLALQALDQLRHRYDVDVVVWLVGPPDDWAAPERDRLIAYARQDCARLAQRSGLSFADPGQQPSTDGVKAAQHAFVQAIGTPDLWSRALEISTDLWAGRSISPSVATGPDPCASGSAQRARLGHFMSAMLFYGGEWYWGLDRLHYLEARLAELGARHAGTPDAPIFLPPEADVANAKRSDGARPQLHWYLSFRSPYTYLATQRVKALADAHGAELRLRFVLPMVMRGLAVPPMKSRYFTLDTAREARRLGVPFGRIADPVGKPVERGYALLPWARDQGRGFEFVAAFMTAVWSQGVDAGSEGGLARIVRAAGLDWDQARTQLGSQAWREEAEANRQELLERGHWGVPCFRVGDVCVWGQDRLWVIDEALRGQAR